MLCSRPFCLLLAATGWSSALAQPAVDDIPTLGTVIVQAPKRPQPAGDVPISMTVLAERDIERTRGGMLEDIQQLVPGFSVDQQAGFNAVTVRGVGGGGRNIGFDPRVGVYLDGVYMGQAQALRQPLFDVEQIEVLRGPQGHLYGRNTVAGAVNMTTRAPTEQFESAARAVAGNKGIREVYANVSGPLSDRLRGKIAVAAETRDGFGANLYDGGQLDDLRRYTLRSQLVVLPTDRLKISLSADASRTKQDQIDGESTSDLFEKPLAGGQLPKRTMNVDTTPSETVDLAGANLTASYTMAGGHVLTAVLGYRDTRQVKRMDNDYRPEDLLRTLYVDCFKQSSQELRVASPDRKDLRYVAGLYRLQEEAITDRNAFIGRDVDTTLVLFPDVPDPLPFGPATGVLPDATVSNAGTVNTDAYALFGALDYGLTEAITLNLGARYTHETKDVRFDLNGAGSGLFDIGSLSDYRDARSESRVTPTIGATYAVSEHQNAYAKFARAFKSGGWNVEFLSSNGARNPAFGSESADSFEIGTKGRALGGGMRYALAAFTSRFTNYQVFQFVDLGAGATSIELRNAAEAVSRGFEGDLALRVARGLDVGMRFSAVNAFFKNFENCSPTVNCTGHRLPYAPRFAAALTANYGLPLAAWGGRLQLYGEYSHRGMSFADPVNDPVTQNIPSRWLVNIRLAYLPAASQWELSLWARNLFDRDTVIMRERDFLGNLIDRRLDPRTVGVEARLNF